MTAEGGRIGTGAALGAIAANILEYYDFAVYGFVAADIGRTFFPALNPVNSLLASFAVFGMGFLARPLGGVILGRLGDLRGRKAALVLAMYLMALGTLATAVVPGYAAIGLAAPLVVLLARLLQGFSLGGAAGLSTAFIVEWAASGRRGFYGSLQQATSTFAFLFGSAAAAFTSTVLSPAAFAAWGWRIPFLFGALLGLVTLYLQTGIDETPEYRRLKSAGGALAESPVSTARFLGQVARTVGFALTWTVAFYIFLIFMPAFTRAHAGLSGREALWASTIGLLSLVAAIPPLGRLSDRIGRKPILLAGCLCFFVLPYPLFTLALAKPPFIVIVLVQIALDLSLATFCAVAPAAVSELFQTAGRSTGMTTGLALATAFFGGFAPYLGFWLIKVAHSPVSPVFYVMATAVVSFAVIAGSRETAFSSG